MLKFDRTKLKIALLELERERKVREFYYPKAVSEGKLSQAEAQRRLEALSYAIEVLMALTQQEEVTTDGSYSNLS
jgi:DNA topoisomerase VI subunit A